MKSNTILLNPNLVEEDTATKDKPTPKESFEGYDDYDDYWDELYDDGVRQRQEEKFRRSNKKKRKDEKYDYYQPNHLRR